MMCTSFRRGVPLSFSDSMGLEKSVTERKRGREIEREMLIEYSSERKEAGSAAAAAAATAT